MTKLTKEFMQDIISGNGFGVTPSAVAEMARQLLASMEQEPVAWLLSGGGAKNDVRFDSSNAYADPLREVTPLYAAPQPDTVVPDEQYQHLSELYHAQEKRLFKIAQRIKGPAFDKYAYSPSQAIDVLESAIFGEQEGDCAAIQSFGNSEQPEPVSNHDELPVTQFKPVADLYGITSPTGSETIFTFDAVEARDFIDGGWSVQEYVELERYQEAMIGNSPATPDGWIPVSERLPDDTVDADGGATCYLVLYAEGRQPNGGSNVQVSNVTYLRRWHEGMITHWMPLPEPPMK